MFLYAKSETDIMKTSFCLLNFSVCIIFEKTNKVKKKKQLTTLVKRMMVFSNLSLHTLSAVIFLPVKIISNITIHFKSISSQFKNFTNIIFLIFLHILHNKLFTKFALRNKHNPEWPHCAKMTL